MSTRSTITIINPDLSAKQIYCHWDGYLSYNGEVLLAAYKTPRKVAELIRHGDADHLGFTPKPANLYKDGITMDNEYEKIHQPLERLAKDNHLSYNKEFKMENEYSNITGNYTFYFNRDRHENSKANEPISFSPESTKKSWDFAKSIKNKNLEKVSKDTWKHISCAVMPSEEYNYFYDASSAHPQWYVTYTDLVDSKPIYDTDASGHKIQVGANGGHWVSRLEPLRYAVLHNKGIKGPKKDYERMKHSWLNFVEHPYNPTYNQFMSNIRRKYTDIRSKQGISKHTIKQNFINPHQLSLF